MKAFTVLATAALLVAINTDSAAAKPGFLEKIPNAEAAGGKSLGHTDSELSAFGKEFKKANFDWAKVCSQPFPGADMTAGEALGDPCCEWKSGAAPQKIDAFVSGKPVKKTTCSKNNPTTAPSPASPTTAPSPASPTTAPSPYTPSSPTTAPSPTQGPAPSPITPSSPTMTPGKPTTSPSTPATPAPGPKPSAKPNLRPGSKCKAQREQKSMDDDEDEDDN
ncbi:hypothetical protein P43SY_004382 [Pythium insidiosum]|uniref:Temptin Cys/Cys disulfide domain-containing protein n=1 Tax=Pythium insidiosum TaxID=114742 RepID=A0AAD5MA22_PYTIN|nr:hypothetical protein P43SY_004382 [Pythium insidiosum]